MHTTLIRDITTPTAGFEPAIPASERSYTDALDSAATEIGSFTLHVLYKFKNYFLIFLQQKFMGFNSRELEKLVRVRGSTVFPRVISAPAYFVHDNF